jgi:DNA-binding CsgD family transcriptional regulator
MVLTQPRIFMIFTGDHAYGQPCGWTSRGEAWVATLATEPPPGGLPRFVGREQELSTLREALAEPAVVLVEGEAGIGKSRLVQEFLAGAVDRHRILRGACPPLREPLMLGPVVEALRPYGDTVAGLRLSALAGVLRPLFPEWTAVLPPAPESLADGKAARHRLFRALADLIDALGAEVLVVEDVHWADVVTLEFLLFLASRRQPPPASPGPSNGTAGPGTVEAAALSLVVTYRPEEVPAESLLLRLSSRLPVGGRHLRVPVPPLDRADTAELVSSMLDGESVSAAFAGFLHQRTDGVPLALEESVRLLHARGDLIYRDGEWVRRKLATLQVPPTVRDAVRERVQRLSEPAQRVLQAAAVLAEPAGEAVVAEVAGTTEESARVGLAEATAGGLLREDARGRVAFRHVLVGQAVYEAIPAVTRRGLHRSAGRVLETFDPPPLAQLTRHFGESREPKQHHSGESREPKQHHSGESREPKRSHDGETRERVDTSDDTAKWIRYAEQTADWAIGSGDYDAAVVRLRDAVAEPEAPAPTRIRLARKLAVAASARPAEVDELHHQAVAALRALLDEIPVSPREEAELRNGLGRLLGILGDLDAARAEVERAVPLLDHDPVEAARAMRFLGLPFVGHSPASVHRRWLQRAAELDLSRLPSRERIALIVDRAAGLLQLGDEDGWAVAAELPITGDSAEERRQIARGYHNLGIAAVLWGRYDQARQLLATAAELTDADSFPRIRPQLEITRAELDWSTGAWNGLPDRIAAVADPEGDEPMSLLAATFAGMWQLAQGAHRRAEALLGAALAEARRLGAVDDTLKPVAALGRIRLLEGRVDDALAQTDEPMRLVAGKGVWLWATELAPVRVEALLAAGDYTGAVALVAAYRRGLAGVTAPAGQAALATCQALLAPAESTTAAEQFGEAARAWERLPRPYDALLARERQAYCQLTAGAPAPALTRLAETFQAFYELGARGDAERLAVRLREHGVDARREWRRGRRGYGDQLSPRELDVVRLVATGATNREVAAALSRSPKTVAGQLSSAMRKLGTASRTELAVAALREGLVAEPPAER